MYIMLTYFPATNLNNACSADAECELGNGGANSGCSTNCVCDAGYIENGGTCAKGRMLNALIP